MMKNLNLRVLEKTYSIHRLAAKSDIPSQVYNSGFFCICKTDNELSIVCESDIKINAEQSVTPWSSFEVVGPLDFSLTGILADLSEVFANANISIFAVSTFDTDYILVRTENLGTAIHELQQSGYRVQQTT